MATASPDELAAASGAAAPALRSGRRVPRRLVDAVLAARLRYYLLRYRRLSADPGVRIAGSLRLRGTVDVHLGAGTRVKRDVRFYGRGRIVVGRHVLLNGSSIGAATTVTIGDWCLIGDADIDDSDYHNLDPARRHEPPTSRTRRPIVLEDNVWVGSKAAIGKGVTVGRDSVVGRGSVIREDVPPAVVVVGNPQRVVKHLTPTAAGQPPR